MEFHVHHTQAHAPSTSQSPMTRANSGGPGSKPTLSSTQLVCTAASGKAPATVAAPMCTDTSALLSQDQAWTSCSAVFQTPREQLEHFLRVGGTLLRDSGPIVPYLPAPGPAGPVPMPYATPAQIFAPTLIGMHHLRGFHPGGLQQDLAVDTRRRQLHNRARVLQSNYSHPAYQQVPTFVVEPAQPKIQGPSRVSEAQVCNLYK